MLCQPEADGRRGKSITKIQEYYMVIRPTKLIKGQGLAKLMAGTNLQAVGINTVKADGGDDQGTEEETYIKACYHQSPWYQDISQLLTIVLCPQGLDKSQKRSLKLRATKSCAFHSELHWRNHDGLLLKCMLEEEAEFFIKDMHQGICGGHFAARETTHKILRFWYYWPTLFSYVHPFFRACHECKIFAGRQKIPALPLKPVQVEAFFQQWGIYFIGEIHPPSSGQHRWILTTTNYFTKWV
uniref:Integrase zinc-binding domain-containing protein n=1 Tax=Picea glauca TaxID=3330 RepID=A0A101LZ25_PICGL|nr:hypothetical protein ABT39_MTgene4996 [Picea glauca]QHR86575.1 hypothetical protein Q903MT_gene578 [Picea sitchensis]